MLVLYGAMIAATAVLFFVIRGYGETLSASAPEAARSSSVPAAAVAHPLLHLLVALAAVIVLGRVLGALFIHLRQPPVIGEVVAGICLGPSLLGQVAPAASEFLLPPSVAPSLSVVAQLGVILYMFLVGLELDAASLRRQGHIALAISHASIIVPFSLGAVLALWLYPRMATSDVTFTAFALFFGVSMSITAFPVLARILTDRQLSKSDLGVMALACAATDDVTAWCLLALAVGVVRSEVGQALTTTLLALGYIGLMIVVVRPLVARALARWCATGIGPTAIAVVLAGVLVSAAVTDAIGVHAIFGAFLFGAIMPHNHPLATQLVGKLELPVTTLLLPAFFAFTGMRTQIGLVHGLEPWLVCLLIIAVATFGKFGGTLAAARLAGLGWRDSASLGTLMNTRGLMELIVLNIGLDLGIISPALFAMMVLMALVTTMATSPILQALIPTPGSDVAQPAAPQTNRSA
jgi:Kef-type K+ transport system membrane component KefB